MEVRHEVGAQLAHHLLPDQHRGAAQQHVHAGQRQAQHEQARAGDQQQRRSAQLRERRERAVAEHVVGHDLDGPGLRHLERRVEQHQQQRHQERRAVRRCVAGNPPEDAHPDASDAPQGCDGKQP